MSKPPIRPMDLANMRSLGVTKVMAYCKCRHEASIDVSGLPDDLFVPEIRLRLRCDFKHVSRGPLGEM
jgi:hypothetical protein